MSCGLEISEEEEKMHFMYRYHIFGDLVCVLESKFVKLEEVIVSGWGYG